MADRTKEINNYIYKTTSQHVVSGILVCGSYVSGNYHEDSDLDILFLVKGLPFEMKLEYFQDTLFDRLLVDPRELIDIISSDSRIARILAHSIGSAHKVIMDSSDIQEILKLCNDKIAKESISYTPRIENRPKILDGQTLTVHKKNNIYNLYKGPKKIV